MCISGEYSTSQYGNLSHLYYISAVCEKLWSFYTKKSNLMIKLLLLMLLSCNELNYIIWLESTYLRRPPRFPRFSSKLKTIVIKEERGTS